MIQTDYNMKPCPFCGKEPRMGKCEGTYGYSSNRYFIKCECGVEMNLFDDFTKPTVECETELINRWNSRK